MPLILTPDTVNLLNPFDGQQIAEFPSLGVAKVEERIAKGQEEKTDMLRKIPPAAAPDGHSQSAPAAPAAADDSQRSHLWQAAYGAACQTIYFMHDIVPTDDQRAEIRALAEGCEALASDVREAAGLGVAAAARWGENIKAQEAGRADAFGLDATARQRSWAGRYDGAE